jgi:hypothetical protein
MSLSSFNVRLRFLVSQTGKFIHIGYEHFSLIKPHYYTVGNPTWYKGMGWYKENVFLLWTTYTAFLIETDMVTEIEIDGIKIWYANDQYVHYENVRKSMW